MPNIRQTSEENFDFWTMKPKEKDHYRENGINFYMTAYEQDK